MLWESTVAIQTWLGMCTYFALHFKNEIPKYLFLKNFGHQSDDKF